MRPFARLWRSPAAQAARLRLAGGLLALAFPDAELVLCVGPDGRLLVSHVPPTPTGNPMKLTTEVTAHGVRVDGRWYSAPQLIAHAGDIVQVEPRTDADTGRAVVLVRNLRGTLLAVAECAEDTLLPIVAQATETAEAA